jgi:excisionase family DNA binding protein
MSRPTPTKKHSLDFDDPYMTVPEVADYLHVHRAWVYRMMDAGRLPYIQLSERVRRVRQSDVQNSSKQRHDRGAGGRTRRPHDLIYALTR